MSSNYDFLNFPGDGSVYSHIESGLAGRSGEHQNMSIDNLGTFAAIHAGAAKESEVAR